MSFILFYYDAIFKDRVLFKQTQSSTEIDIIVVICLFKFCWKVCKIKVEKKVNVLLFNYNYQY